jgi:putative nucleotidyltransferase with HDIG domain
LASKWGTPLLFQSHYPIIKSPEVLNIVHSINDCYTRNHSLRVTEYSMNIGYQLGLSDASMEVLQVGAVLHDIGKSGLDDTLLKKSTRLSTEELKRMRQHPLIGVDMVKDVSFLKEAVPLIQYHHERMDGMGYPEGLKGEEIPFLARIVGVADAYDAMTSPRSYKVALLKEVAIEELIKASGKQFDPGVVEALVSVYQPSNGLESEKSWISSFSISCM